MRSRSDELFKGSRPRRRHRPPPDAPARRLLRQAAPVPARRFRHHRCRHRPRPYGARSWRGRFPAVQGARDRSGVRGRRRGLYRADWLWLGGQGSVINKKFVASDGPICTDLREAGALLAASDDFAHSYPHSWRSKAKVIFRATPQWFIPMDQSAVSLRSRASGSGEGPSKAHRPCPAPSPLAEGERETNGPTLRELALDAIERTRWVPERSQNRIRSMVEGRPDWVISRQRAWGVPIALYVNRATGEYLRDPAVNARIVAGVRGGRRRCVVHRRSPGAARRPTTSSPITSRSPTSSTCGSTAARPTPSRSRRATARASAPTSISKARTSIAAGSSRRCSKAAARAAARRMTPS